LVDDDLSENAIGVQAISKCRSVLDKPTLICLSLSNNRLSAENISEVADILLYDEHSNCCIAEKMTKIHIFNNMSGVEGCGAFARILEKSKILVDVQFVLTLAIKAESHIITSALDSCLAMQICQSPD
jgi:hypothetical protein